MAINEIKGIMKISTFIMMFLVIAGLMTIFSGMSNEAKSYYPNSEINDSEWVGQYDYSEEINRSTVPIQKALANIGDEDKGWFVKILSGIAAIPAAAISFAALALGSFSYGAGIITGTLSTLGLSGTLIAIIIIMIIVWGIIKLIEVYQRWNI